MGPGGHCMINQYLKSYAELTFHHWIPHKPCYLVFCCHYSITINREYLGMTDKNCSLPMVVEGSVAKLSKALLVR